MNISGLQENIVLAPYTTFKIGGPARYFLVATTKDQVIQAVQQAQLTKTPWYILGQGSNLLVADKGYDGLVIKSELREIEFNLAKQQVLAGSGVLINKLIRQAATQELSGLEYAIGVPATVGGAVWANLGAHGSEFKDLLIQTTVLDESGKEKALSVAECEYGYRDSVFKHKKYVILDALLQFKAGNKKEINALIKQYTDKRKKTQDVGAKCAGSIFRNPTDQTNESAGKLIDDLGLKRFAIGGAQVSDVHANVIVNTGNATAEDVIILISLLKQKVRDNKGVQLMEEIEYVGL